MHILIKKAYIYWSYENSIGTMKFKIDNDPEYTFEDGYYTFSDIKKTIGDQSNKKVEVTLNKMTAKASIKCDNSTDITLSPVLSKMLGFENTEFKQGTTTISTGHVDINKGFRYIKIHCNLVDQLYNINEHGKRDDTVLSLPIVSTQSLFGSVSRYTDIESKVKINKGVINNLRFNVTDPYNDPITVGVVLLECYIVSELSSL